MAQTSQPTRRKRHNRATQEKRSDRVIIRVRLRYKDASPSKFKAKAQARAKARIKSQKEDNVQKAAFGDGYINAIESDKIFVSLECGPLSKVKGNFTYILSRAKDFQGVRNDLVKKHAAFAWTLYSYGKSGDKRLEIEMAEESQLSPAQIERINIDLGHIQSLFKLK